MSKKTAFTRSQHTGTIIPAGRLDHVEHSGYRIPRLSCSNKKAGRIGRSGEVFGHAYPTPEGHLTVEFAHAGTGAALHENTVNLRPATLIRLGKRAPGRSWCMDFGRVRLRGSRRRRSCFGLKRKSRCSIEDRA